MVKAWEKKLKIKTEGGEKLGRPGSKDGRR